MLLFFPPCGCSPLVLVDGVYQCVPNRSGACPAGMVCQWSVEVGDHRCYFAPPHPSQDAASPSDARSDATWDGGGTDAGVEQVILSGTIWSPGADEHATLEVNRFPIPGAVVTAFHAPPEDLPQGTYCHECGALPEGVPSVIADPVTGEFELLLRPDTTYFLSVQKGEFRRVRQITVPNMPGEVWELPHFPEGPRPEELTLPNQYALGAGDNVPRIAVVNAQYEDMSQTFESLGFVYGGSDVLEVQGSIANNRAELDQFNLLVVPCGINWPGGEGHVIQQWVKDGGKLFVADFNYDFVEIPFPDFLSWWTGTEECGTSLNPTDGNGKCNHWSSYHFNGDPGDADFGDWLSLPEVNRGASLNLKAAWDIIYSIKEGIVGETDDCVGSCGPNGEVYRHPKVWMYDLDRTSPVVRPPATVSWPYYCGRVLYTVYHTHSSDEQPYRLLLQEKIMIYLLMEIQTCSATLVTP